MDNGKKGKALGGRHALLSSACFSLPYLDILRHQIAFHNLLHQRSVLSKQSTKQKGRQSFHVANLSVIGQKAHDESMKLPPPPALCYGGLCGGK